MILVIVCTCCASSGGGSSAGMFTSTSDDDVGDDRDKWENRPWGTTPTVEVRPSGFTPNGYFGAGAPGGITPNSGPNGSPF